MSKKTTTNEAPKRGPGRPKKTAAKNVTVTKAKKPRLIKAGEYTDRVPDIPPIAKKPMNLAKAKGLAKDLREIEAKQISPAKYAQQVYKMELNRGTDPDKAKTIAAEAEFDQVLKGKGTPKQKLDKIVKKTHARPSTTPDVYDTKAAYEHLENKLTTQLAGLADRTAQVSTATVEAFESRDKETGNLRKEIRELRRLVNALVEDHNAEIKVDTHKRRWPSIIGKRG